MNLTVFHELRIGSACICALGIILGVYSWRLSASLIHGKIRLLAYILGAAGICSYAVTLIVFHLRAPVYFAEGTILAVQVHTAGRGSYRSNVVVQVGSGELQLIADGRSTWFRPGQKVKLKYESYTGSILKAEFLSASRQKEGVFNGTFMFAPYMVMLFGLFVLWAGIRKHRLDPEGYGV